MMDVHNNINTIYNTVPPGGSKVYMKLAEKSIGSLQQCHSTLKVSQVSTHTSHGGWYWISMLGCIHRPTLRL